MQHRMVRRLAVCLAVSLLYAPASGAEDQKRTIDERHMGYPYYRQYCASCHGLYADGQGIVAPLLRQPVPDLTMLSQKYGSPLPEARIADFIEGEAMPRTHGGTDMPIWGRRLRSELPPLIGLAETRRAIINLVVDYLAVVQRDAKPSNGAPGNVLDESVTAPGAGENGNPLADPPPVDLISE